MTNTSSPRTFSWISAKISMSEKRLMLALVSCWWRQAAIASDRGLLLFPARIFIVSVPRGRERARRKVSTRHPPVNRAENAEIYGFLRALPFLGGSGFCEGAGVVAA